MFASLDFLLTLAEGEAQRGPGQDSFLVILIPVSAMLLLYFVMDSPRRKAQAKRDLMIKNLKKTDRVVTIGGIFGSVVNVSADGKEVTLKVDDSTRIKFRRSAIAEVLGEETAEATKAS